MTTAWPFLIARGRRRGYTVLAAPAFLASDGEEGFLEEVVGPTPDRVATRDAHSPRGHHLYLTWADHRVVGSDLDEPTDPVDEHSRPLRLLHGYLCQDTPPAPPTPADLARSLSSALATYRRFLRDEEAFTVEESTPFPVTARAAAPSPAPPNRPFPLLTALVTAAVVTLVALVAGLLLLTGDEQPPTEHLVATDQIVAGTIRTAGQQDTYVLGTGPATAIALRDDLPTTLDVQLHNPDTGTTLPPDRTGCWQVTANTRYRLTVTSAVGDYTFRLDSSPGCATTQKNPPG